LLDDPAADPAADAAAGDAAANRELAPLVAVVERLRATDRIQPSPEFRAQLRGRLVQLAATPAATSVPTTAPAAEAETALLEPVPAEPDATTTPETPRQPHEPASLPARWRPPRLGLVAAGLVLLVLAGAALFGSRNALPGDPLYALKRGTEQAGLALARDDGSRGLRYLHLAGVRAAEIRDLAGRAGAGPTTFIDTLGVLDAQTAAGVRLLTSDAVRQTDDGTLVTVGNWTVQQYGLLQATVSHLPADAQPRLRDSLALLRRVGDRVVALRGRLSCSCLAGATSDDLGPLPSCSPCGTAQVPASSTPTGPARSAPPARSGAPTRTAPPPSPSSGGRPPGRPGPSRGSGSPSGGGLPLPIPLPTGGGTSVPLPSIPGLPLPSSIPLPLPLPSLPLPSIPGLPLPTGLLPGLLPGQDTG
jgi:hypothetical protein